MGVALQRLVCCPSSLCLRHSYCLQDASKGLASGIDFMQNSKGWTNKLLSLQFIILQGDTHLCHQQDKTTPLRW